MRIKVTKVQFWIPICGRLEFLKKRFWTFHNIFQILKAQVLFAVNVIKFEFYQTQSKSGYQSGLSAEFTRFVNEPGA